MGDESGVAVLLTEQAVTEPQALYGGQSSEWSEGFEKFH